MNKRVLAILFAASALLAGCASDPAQAPADSTAENTVEAETGSQSGEQEGATAAPAADTAQATEEVPPEPIEYGNFTEEQLYQAIISEISGQRGDLAQAGDNYLDLAMDTRDLNIIRRAVQFASVNGDTNALLQLGLLWTQVAPQDPQPHLILSFEFLENGNFDEALSHMARVIDLGADMDFTALTARTGQLSHSDRSRLIQSMRGLSEEFPEQQSIRLALVQLLAQNQQYELALAELERLNEDGSLTPMLVRLEAQILQSQGDSEGALRTLRGGVREFPGNRIIRMSYARLLVQNELFGEARQQFQQLVEESPTDWETWYSLALLDMELENWDSAADIFQRLVRADERTDESHFYLGMIYEEQGDIERAIEQFRQVRIGTNNYLAAQQQATRLAIAEGQLDEAHSWLVGQSRGQPRLEVLFTTVESGALIEAGHSERARALLDEALNKYPNEADLLFARVLLNDSLGNLAASEEDLRQIISMQPDNAQALNHLGYMLADQTERYEEALELIERAIAISPDDPAIIDSLGWAQYKLGQYEQAVSNLRRAYAAFPDPEVAAHLGEVLWKMERREEAMEVWQESLQARPDSDLVRNTMDRLIED